MAQQDPNGNPTTGIVRKYTDSASFSYDNDGVKYSAQGGDDIWDRDRYLNIWVCNLTAGESSYKVAGYSSFPGGLQTSDGIVVLYKVFGRTDNHNTNYNLGRTATHEVGHWLNLYHPWGSGGTDDCGDSSCNCTDDCAGYSHTESSKLWLSCIILIIPVQDTSDMFMTIWIILMMIV